MKKTVLLIIILFTGCTSVKKDNLICTNKFEEDKIIVNQGIDIEVSNDVIKKVIINRKYNIIDKAKPHKEKLLKLLKDRYEGFSNKGVTLNVDSDNEFIYIDVSINTSTATDETIDNYIGSKLDINTNIDALRIGFENEGFICNK